MVTMAADDHRSYSSTTASTSDSVTRRYQAATWLQRTVGPLDLPIDPSEEDMRLCLRDGTVLSRLLNKLDPTLISKVLEVDDLSHDSISQDSLKGFLKAVTLLKIPAFERLDLEQPNYRPSSIEKVVDCLLSLRSYYDFMQTKDDGLKRYDVTLNVNLATTRKDGLASPSSARSTSHLTPRSPMQSRRRWVIPEPDSSVDMDLPIGHFSSMNGGNSQVPNAPPKPSSHDLVSTDENYAPSHSQSSAGSNHIHHISQKFREILRLKTRGPIQDQAASTNAGVLNSLDSVSNLVNAILGDKQQEEVPALVEYMLKKVMEEFERRLVTQSEQVANLRSTLKEHLTREDRLASRARVLETLAVGTGEEVKIVHNQLQKLKIDKKKAEDELKLKEHLMSKLQKENEDGQITVAALENEILNLKQKHQEEVQELEAKRQELKEDMQNEFDKLETLQRESMMRMQELQALAAAEMQVLKQREERYQSFILSNIGLCRDMKLALEATKQECALMNDAWSEESRALGQQLHALSHAASGYHKVLAENRRLHNEVQDLKGNIRVYCRVRPFLGGQETKQSVVEFIGENGDLLLANPKQVKDGHKMFTFNKTFGPSASQEEVFMDTQPLIRSVLDGYNVCIFAYGQTGSGKTFTMTGPNSLTEKDWGVNYRALNDLFHISQSREDVVKYEVAVQMVEIYNEQVRDLLMSDCPNKKLEIRNYSQLNGLNLPDATMLPVSSTSDVLELIKIGQKNRAVGATALNERSSRSHSVLTVHVQGTDLASGSILRACLHLVDLAGSERVDRSEVTGDRLKEAQHINKSLSALGDVVSALAQKNSHVPYRNSKLTQLLQNSLAGQAKTLMFVHISPDTESYGETISTLKFAERVASVELGAARSNKESKEVRDLKEQVAMLKEIINKKDAEIDRLQVIRSSSLEVEKFKSRDIHHIKPPVVDLKHQRLRRQTVDMASCKEKPVPAQALEGSQLADFNTHSPPSSPKDVKRSQDSTQSKEKIIDSRPFCRSRSDDNLANRSPELANRSPELLNRSPEQIFEVEKNELLTEGECQPKDWGDRVHSSTDSSLLGSASLDDVSSVSDSVERKLTVDDVSPPKDLHEALPSADEGSIKSRIFSKKVHLDRRRTVSASEPLQTNLQDEINRLHARDLDTASEFSDGYFSQTETEASLASTIDHQPTHTSKGHRKPPPPPPPPESVRSSKSDWKSISAGPMNPRARRQSMSASSMLSLESSSSKRRQLAGPRLSAEAPPSTGAGVGAGAGVKQMSQGTSKASKRWI
uniref:Kinesin 14-IIc protein n=1 Tax=Marsilea vestita TaxID=59764 RepID=A0A142KWC9_MARVE|nr:kinesin 14-IIc protein [Marsilea vestita]